MRYLTLALSLGFAVGVTSAALACPSMKSVSTAGQIASTDQAPSTPIKVPAPDADG